MGERYLTLYQENLTHSNCPEIINRGEEFDSLSFIPRFIPMD